MDFQPILEEINAALRPELGREGRVASYIPALARVSPLQFGIALRTCDGQEAQAGDSEKTGLVLRPRVSANVLWPLKADAHVGADPVATTTCHALGSFVRVAGGSRLKDGAPSAILVLSAAQGGRFLTGSRFLRS